VHPLKIDPATINPAPAIASNRFITLPSSQAFARAS
jgi:hypothetical protein